MQESDIQAIVQAVLNELNKQPTGAPSSLNTAAFGVRPGRQ